MRNNQSGIGKQAISTVLTVFALGGFARGQESPQVAPAPPPAAAETAAAPAEPTTSAPQPTPTTLGTVEQAFLQKAAELHATGAELAKLTEKNAGTEEVQALGQELLGEHTRSIAALREIARTRNFEMEASPTATQQATISEFAGKVGQGFDDGYRSQALSNHEDAILLFANAAKTAKDAGVRSFAERSLGEMKERHAAMGGDAVKLKGAIALKIPKTSKSAAKPTAKDAKTTKGRTKPAGSTASEAIAATAVASEPSATGGTGANPAPSIGRTVPAANTAAAESSSLIGAGSSGASVPSTVVQPPPATSPARAANAASAQGRRAIATQSRDPRLAPIIGAEPLNPVEPGLPPVAAGASAEARAQWRIPAEMAEEAAAPRRSQRTTARSTRATPGPAAYDDEEIATAPVARVVVRPASNGRSAREPAPGTAGPSGGARRVIIRQAPARTFRIFESGDDD